MLMPMLGSSDHLQYIHSALHANQLKLHRNCMQIRYQDSDDFVESRRFVGVCWGPGQPATTLTLVDETGALIDILHAGSFSGAARRPYNRDMPYRVLEDPLRVSESRHSMQPLCKVLLELHTGLYAMHAMSGPDKR